MKHYSITNNTPSHLDLSLLGVTLYSGGRIENVKLSDDQFIALAGAGLTVKPMQTEEESIPNSWVHNYISE